MNNHEKLTNALQSVLDADKEVLRLEQALKHAEAQKSHAYREGARVVKALYGTDPKPILFCGTHVFTFSKPDRGLAAPVGSEAKDARETVVLEVNPFEGYIINKPAPVAPVLTTNKPKEEPKTVVITDRNEQANLLAMQAAMKAAAMGGM